MRDIEYFKETLYKTSKGYVSLAFADEETWKEYIYRVKEISTQMTLFENNQNINIYSSVNTFYQPKRPHSVFFPKSYHWEIQDRIQIE